MLWTNFAVRASALTWFFFISKQLKVIQSRLLTASKPRSPQKELLWWLRKHSPVNQVGEGSDTMNKSRGSGEVTGERVGLCAAGCAGKGASGREQGDQGQDLQTLVVNGQ